MKKLFVFATILACAMNTYAQAFFGEKPKLVVGIVVDQMRWDYLDRYYNQFTDGGFRRLINEGYSCNNCLINYVPTITAIGHSSAYTGSTPALHGICGNTFYIDGKKTYCTQDDNVETVGSNTEKGKESPRNLLATTIGDQLRLHTDFKSRVIGISYKDRGAILPAGHSANAAYWLDTKAKPVCFISSTYYMQELPQWAKDINKQIAKNKEVVKHGDKIGLSYLCGTITTDMAIAALQNEKLGNGEATDMLCVSYSQTDVIGHKWSTRGENTDEAYLQLDKDLARLFNALDAQVGKGNYLLFLTADHGAAHNYKFMQDHKINAGQSLTEQIKAELEKTVSKAAHKELKPIINGILDYRVFLNHKAIEEQGLELEDVKKVIINHLISSPNISFAADYEELAKTTMHPAVRDRIIKGYHPRRSGDIYFVVDPGYYDYGSWSSPIGTTHGAWNPYDSHIPLLFMGWKVPHGATSREVHITDIAPTVCQLLHIQQPNACVGEAITEITK
ncbi:MAG: alkaline phosphatase family protein [Prevotella sp.]|nr:alkaline phosphatase family protein [Prevotella sp.]